jgi:uncharacterized protein YdaU (DUF1376 family)
MNKNKPPAFQFYPGDFLSDETVAMMNHEERGIYITLLCHCWLEGSIPADEAKIARLIHCKSEALAPVMHAFATSEADASRLIHPRLEEERLKQQERRSLLSEAGKKGGRPRVNAAEKPRLNEARAERKPQKALQSSSSAFGNSASLIRSCSPPSLEDCVDEFTRAGGTEEMAKAFHVKHESCEWMHGHTPIRHWRPLVGKYIANWRATTSKSRAVNGAGLRHKPDELDRLRALSIPPTGHIE